MEIVFLPKAQWKDYRLPFDYTTDSYYDVRIEEGARGFSVSIEKRPLARPITHTQEEYGFPDRLYEPHWEAAQAWGILVDGALIAAIETNPEEWSNRLRITELWVDADYRKRGLGHALMERAKRQARGEKRRAVILETQSCNVNAVDFYRHEGFTLIGFDSCCYQNNDIERKEVRLEMGYFFNGE